MLVYFLVMGILLGLIIQFLKVKINSLIDKDEDYFQDFDEEL